MQTYLVNEITRDHQSAMIRQAERERMASAARPRDDDARPGFGNVFARLSARFGRRPRLEPRVAGV